MITDTEGIVLGQVKALGGRRMILLFSKKYGKISVGTSMNEGGRSKAALAVRAFSYGRYELFKSRESYNLNSGQVLRSYYSLGEDLDKYTAASFVLELTEKVLPENCRSRGYFAAAGLSGNAGKTPSEARHAGAGLPCQAAGRAGQHAQSRFLRTLRGQRGRKRGEKAGAVQHRGGRRDLHFLRREQAEPIQQPLIYQVDVGIIDILKYFQKQPLQAFEKLALDEPLQTRLTAMTREYISYHLDIGRLKSESLLQI